MKHFIGPALLRAHFWHATLDGFELRKALFRQNNKCKITGKLSFKVWKSATSYFRTNLFIGCNSSEARFWYATLAMGHFEKHFNGRFHKHHQTQSEWIRLQMQLTLYSVFGCETSGLFKLVVLIPSIGAVWEHFQLQTVSAGEHPELACKIYGKVWRLFGKQFGDWNSNHSKWSCDSYSTLNLIISGCKYYVSTLP